MLYGYSPYGLLNIVYFRTLKMNVASYNDFIAQTAGHSESFQNPDTAYKDRFCPSSMNLITLDLAWLDVTRRSYSVLSMFLL